MRPRFGRLIWIASSMVLLLACSLVGPAVEPEEAERTELTEVPTVVTEVTDEPTAVTPMPTLEGPLYILDGNWPVSQAQPGDTVALSVGIMVCCVFYDEVEAEASWTVEPHDAASIDDAGLLSVNPDATHGMVLTVTAVLVDTGQTVSAPVTIYTPGANPLVGRWREDVQYTCETGEAFTPPDPIQELIFEADQTFKVTWFPFEVYVDYWGGYTYDLEHGTLNFQVDGNNYLPSDFDGEGTFFIDEQGGLVLTDIWLGTPSTRGEQSPGGLKCGHRFVR
jgi:hypothetical protein